MKFEIELTDEQIKKLEKLIDIVIEDDDIYVAEYAIKVLINNL